MNKATKICIINDITSIDLYLANTYHIEMMVSVSSIAPISFSQRICRILQNLQNDFLC